MIDFQQFKDSRKIEEFIIDAGLHPLLGAMVESLQIPNYIDRLCGPFDKRLLLTPGQLAKALIVNVLDGRTPIYKVAESFESVDCEVFFGQGIKAEDLTEDRLGTALDLIGELDLGLLFSHISMRAMQLYGIQTDVVHIDTTNFSVFGEYDTEDYKGFNATACGAPKSGRRDLKAIGLGTAVTGNKTPFLFEALSGKSSDAVWFRSALTETTKLFQGDLYSRPVLIFDAAASNKEMFESASTLEAPSIIRLSRVFKEAEEAVCKAWEENNWQHVGVLATNKKGASEYKISSYDFHEVSGWRLIVVHSSGLEKSKRKSLDKNIATKRETIEKDAIVLGKKVFESKEKAIDAAEKLVKKHITAKIPLQYSVDVVTEEIEKYARPGRPTPNTPKITVTNYYVKFRLGETDVERYNSIIQQESCFVLVDNVPKDRCSDKEILERYKGQWRIENTFQFIKTPLDFGPLWLNTPKRIKALLFLIVLSVLTANFLLYRLHASLSGNPCGEEDPKAHPRKFADVTGRRVDKPTYNMVREHLLKLKVIIYYDQEQKRWVREFPRQTRNKLLQIIVDIGFNPKIYLEPYRGSFDLWCYS